MKKKSVLIVFVSVLVGSAVRGQPKFYDDDPLLVEERVDVPNEPAPVKLSDLYDRFRHTFGAHEDSERSEAANVNTADEVPASPWYTNRHGTTRSTIADLVRGPNRGAGPMDRQPWTVVAGKKEGLTPGFEVVDGKGDRYLMKLEPADVPELSSAAEIIATKLFHALGYNVPENYLVRFDPSELRIAPEAEFLDRFGNPAKLTETRLRRMLEGVARRPDGKVRAVASKLIDGRPLGPFRYSGTRSDDPNDIIPHEDRRELRGLRLFAAWLNHDDARAHNTLDSWVREEGTSYVRHYLIDFGSTFGSGTVDLQLPNLSFHYWLDFDLMKKNALGFGFHVPRYRKVKWPNFPEYRTVGRWESSYFDPEGWKTDYPNPAFVRMTPRDAFWAAKIVMRFAEDELRAIVRTGEISNPDEEAYFLETLLERQRKSGRYGLNGVNPIDEFRIVDGRLEFTNLSEKYGFAEPRSTYEVTWSIYDNGEDVVRVLTAPVTLADASARLPAIRAPLRAGSHPALALRGGVRLDVRSDRFDGESVLLTTNGGALRTVPRASVDLARTARLVSETNGGMENTPPQVDDVAAATILRDGEFLLAEIQTNHPDHPHWSSRIGVYLRSKGDGYEVVGVERGSYAPSGSGEER